MSVTICEADQRSREWLEARLGRVTGSSAKHLLAVGRTKGEEAVVRRDLKMRLALERLTNHVLDEDTYINKEMQRGIDCEPLARVAYEAMTGDLVRCTGFLAHDALPIGCSLDGDVNDLEGILEIKCPKSATHWKAVKSKTVPSEHLAQITHNLYVSGAAWCDFVSWDDRFPASVQICTVRLYRKDVDLEGYEYHLRVFLAEVDTELAALRTITDLPGVLAEAVA